MSRERRPESTCLRQRVRRDNGCGSARETIAHGSPLQNGDMNVTPRLTRAELLNWQEKEKRKEKIERKM